MFYHYLMSAAFIPVQGSGLSCARYCTMNIEVSAMIPCLVNSKILQGWIYMVMVYDGYDLWLTHKIVSLKQLELSANTCIPNEVADVNILTAVVLDWPILLVLFLYLFTRFILEVIPLIWQLTLKNIELLLEYGSLGSSRLC